MCEVLPLLHRFWETLVSDRGLAISAILLGVGGIWRSEHLFKKLDNNLEHLPREWLFIQTDTTPRTAPRDGCGESIL